MNKLLAMFFLLFLLSGCAEENHGEYCFYYPRAVYTQNSIDSVISCEYRDIPECETATDFLNYYLAGPIDPMLRDPFPPDVFVLNVQLIGNTVHVTVSDQMALLSGTDTILACGSLGKTAAVYFGVNAAQIECQTAKLNGRRYIRIDEQNLQYLDEVPQEAPAETTE